MVTKKNTLKILLIGDSGVGKSSILMRFTEGVYEEEVTNTIGVDCKAKSVELGGGESVNLTIWDTAGQEKFRSLTSSYYRGANGVIIVYDVHNRETFEHLDEWLNEVEMYCNRARIVVLLVANKVDKTRAVSKEEGAAWARSHSTLFLETSAKNKIGIEQAFEELSYQIIENSAASEKSSSPTPNPSNSDSSINLISQTPNDSYACC